jgi:hypothetical protein
VNVPDGEEARAHSFTATPSTVIAPGVNEELSVFPVVTVVVVVFESSSDVESQSAHVELEVKFPVAQAINVAIASPRYLQLEDFV